MIRGHGSDNEQNESKIRGKKKRVKNNVEQVDAIRIHIDIGNHKKRSQSQKLRPTKKLTFEVIEEEISKSEYQALRKARQDGRKAKEAEIENVERVDASSSYYTEGQSEKDEEQIE